MPSSLTLATEICEQIVDILSQDMAKYNSSFRNRTLSACALTSPSWLPRSRLHLYSSVYLDTHQIKSFIASLTLYPSNGRLVRYLELLNNGNGSDLIRVLVLIQLPHSLRLPNLVHISFFRIDFSVPRSSFFAYLRGFHTVRYLSCTRAFSSSLHRITQLVRSFPHLERFRTYGWLKTTPESLSPTPLTTSRLYHKVRVPHLVWVHDVRQEHVLSLFSPGAVVSLSIDYVTGEDDYNQILLFLHECKNTHLDLILSGSAPKGDSSA